MQNTLLGKGLVVGIIVLFVSVGVFSSASSKDISFSDDKVVDDNNGIKPLDEYLLSAFLYGKIEILNKNEYLITFRAINLRILTFFPFKFYHFNSGEIINIECSPAPPIPDAFTIIGIFTDNIIFAYCEFVFWDF